MDLKVLFAKHFDGAQMRRPDDRSLGENPAPVFLNMGNTG
jgi:hypothetical protein